jgi:hypothetical protein
MRPSYQGLNGTPDAFKGLGGGGDPLGVTLGPWRKMSCLLKPISTASASESDSSGSVIPALFALRISNLFETLF